MDYIDLTQVPTDRIKSEYKRRRFSERFGWLSKCAEANGVYLPEDILKILQKWIRRGNSEINSIKWRTKFDATMDVLRKPGITCRKSTIDHEHRFPKVTVAGVQTLARTSATCTAWGHTWNQTTSEQECLICNAAKFTWLTPKEVLKAFKYCSTNRERFLSQNEKWEREDYRRKTESE